MKKNNFRTELAETIFYARYALSHNQTWWDKARSIVDDVCGFGYYGQHQAALMSKEERGFLVEAIYNFKFLPGGRYIYYAGRKARFWNNCFSGETEVLTDNGKVSLREVAGKTVNLLSPIDGQYYEAKVYSHGKQPLNKITFKAVRGHQRHKWSVRATRTHHWPLIDGKDTYDLRVGDVVPANSFSAPFDALGFAHGFVFGDGTEKGQLRLCSNKGTAYLDVLRSAGATVTYPEHAKGDPCLYFSHKINWKKVPVTKDSSYIASFIKGWLAADGNETSSGHKLCSVDRSALEWFRENAALAGITITGELRSQIRDVILGDYSYDGHEIYIQSYRDGETFSGYKVVSIEEDGEEEVFCPFEPVHNRFVLEGNIDTFNCYLLKGTADTREEWAAIVQRSMSCLTTGGGIGVDYSVFRPAGEILRRTGGEASGPIPLMNAVNEIGRNVMQGGSRRSAIYASLNWQHDDAWDFLHAKNWDELPVKGTGKSMADIKKEDFLFPCPLDMTNISLNYDNAWRDAKEGRLTETFIENCKQALRTGEPGFSFNFDEKENETLRNA